MKNRSFAYTYPLTIRYGLFSLLLGVMALVVNAQEGVTPPFHHNRPYDAGLREGNGVPCGVPESISSSSSQVSSSKPIYDGTEFIVSKQVHHCFNYPHLFALPFLNDTDAAVSTKKQKKIERAKKKALETPSLNQEMDVLKDSLFRGHVFEPKQLDFLLDHAKKGQVKAMHVLSLFHENKSTYRDDCLAFYWSFLAAEIDWLKTAAPLPIQDNIYINRFETMCQRFEGLNDYQELQPFCRLKQVFSQASLILDNEMVHRVEAKFSPSETLIISQIDRCSILVKFMGEIGGGDLFYTLLLEYHLPGIIRLMDRCQKQIPGLDMADFFLRGAWKFLCLCILKDTGVFSRCGAERIALLKESLPYLLKSAQKYVLKKGQDQEASVQDNPCLLLWEITRILCPRSYANINFFSPQDLNTYGETLCFLRKTGLRVSHSIPMSLNDERFDVSWSPEGLRHSVNARLCDLILHHNYPKSPDGHAIKTSADRVRIVIDLVNQRLSDNDYNALIPLAYLLSSGQATPEQFKAHINITRLGHSLSPWALLSSVLIRAHLSGVEDAITQINHYACSFGEEEPLLAPQALIDECIHHLNNLIQLKEISKKNPERLKNYTQKCGQFLVLMGHLFALAQTTEQQEALLKMANLMDPDDSCDQAGHTQKDIQNRFEFFETAHSVYKYAPALYDIIALQVMYTNFI